MLVCCSLFYHRFVGVGARRVRSLFQAAKKKFQMLNWKRPDRVVQNAL
ncbi:hypothetical protein ZOSMA_219G00040 [Zostera marina]|uniref:Uncharacterized protein n=1 Tax=Zostera marina TaxID=29655 RepID=A0A0K9PM14_ZOSMR|nr:hypothetical protein ZOSMA_219G00040 [Zostera marina]